MVNSFVIVYLDNILIYSKDPKDHDGHVRAVLARLRKYNLFAKASKCEFDQDKVEFLGFEVNTEGVKPNPAKVKTIKEWPLPKTVKQVQSFLGFANFYRRFVNGYLKIVKCLTNLTKKDVAFAWKEEHQKAFEHLKDCFTSSQTMAHFDPELDTVLETDASDYAMGAILLQVGHNGVLRPVAFESRSLAAAQLNYEIHNKEMLAIILALTKWRTFLQSTTKRFDILTDNKSLKYFMTSKLLNRRQARWNEFLADFVFEICYRPGTQGAKPDALLRRADHYPQEGEGAYALHNKHNFKQLLSQCRISVWLGCRGLRWRCWG